MLIVAVVDIGQTLKACCQAFAHVLFALETSTPRMAPPWHLENTIVGEERHDAIEIVRVEGLAELPQCRSNVHRDGSCAFDLQDRSLATGPVKAVTLAQNPSWNRSKRCSASSICC